MRSGMNVPNLASASFFIASNCRSEASFALQFFCSSSLARFAFSISVCAPVASSRSWSSCDPAESFSCSATRMLCSVSSIFRDRSRSSSRRFASPDVAKSSWSSSFQSVSCSLYWLICASCVLTFARSCFATRLASFTSFVFRRKSSFIARHSLSSASSSSHNFIRVGSELAVTSSAFLSCNARSSRFCSIATSFSAISTRDCSRTFAKAHDFCFMNVSRVPRSWSTYPSSFNRSSFSATS
mmetsp:Transcript_9619/g.18126  ORF Transcript_9619/g.18126 Transcript_9619/m.18126 type:complete len:241 (-) Transcript_9619:1038-1760(-)